MALTHTNKVRWRYTAGGTQISDELTTKETDGAVISISQQIVTNHTAETSGILLEYFEFTTANRAKSLYLKLDGFNGDVYATGTDGAGGGSSKMTGLFDGEPYVWSYNNGSGFPAGSENVMRGSTTGLVVHPLAGAGTTTTGTFDLRVLYDPID